MQQLSNNSNRSPRSRFVDYFSKQDVRTDDLIRSWGRRLPIMQSRALATKSEMHACVRASNMRSSYVLAWHTFDVQPEVDGDIIERVFSPICPTILWNYDDTSVQLDQPQIRKYESAYYPSATSNCFRYSRCGRFHRVMSKCHRMLIDTWIYRPMTTTY